MDYSPLGWYHWALLAMLLSITLVTSTDVTVHHAVVCLVSDGPDLLQDELYLHCKQTGVINIIDARHGYREQAADTKTCSPVSGPPGPCSSDDSTFRTQVLKRCMGVNTCYVPVAKAYLDGCKKYSNYVQVQYECVPDNSVEPDNIVDVCGEMMQGSQVSRLSGYIKTPDYPDLYPPDISCSCNLTALDSDAQITLTMLDMQLEQPRDTDCQWDWLEYTTAVHGWGRGTKMCRPPHPTGLNNTFTGNKTILLNFRADNKVEDRGFWLKYEGRNSGGNQVEVLLQCKNFVPNIIKRDTACIDKGGASELFLDCRQENGVINVLTAQHGLRSSDGAKTAGSSSECLYREAPQCNASVSSDDLILRSCMGQGACTLPVSPRPVPSCAAGANSDYLQVKYQCIPAAYEPTNIVDICGDVLNGGAPFRHSGYIQSPNYPQSYSPNLRCQCLLSTDSDAHLKIKMLDIKLKGDSVTSACVADWLRYTMSHSAAWGTGRTLCHEPREKLIDTGVSEIRLDFNSDQSVEDRGFWVHYSALRPDGLHVGVQIMCRQYQEPEITDEIMDNATPLKPDSVNTGLAIGLTVVTVLIIIVIFILIILKYRRIRKGKMEESASTSSARAVIQEKVNNSLNRSSNFGQTNQQNYNTLQGQQHQSLPPALHCDPQREYIEPQPDYDVTDGGSTSSPSYVNPAFDGTLEPSYHYNAAC